MAQTSIGTGFLYNGIDGSSGVTPVCCTPEYLAAYGVGLDTTLGDGKVNGVLREDQAEQQFYAMYKDQYDGAEALQEITTELTDFVGTVKDGTNIKELMKQATAINNGTTPEVGADGKPKVGADGKPKVGADGKPVAGAGTPSPDAVKLAAILKDIEAKITPDMEKLLTQFFGEETVKGAGGGTAGPAGLASIMAGTVIASYDINNDENATTGGGGDQNGANDLSIDAEDKGKIGKSPAVSLGEIFQWSLETNAFLNVYKSAGGGEDISAFTQRAYKAMSEGDTAAFDAIATAAGMEPEQLQVILSSMMNNHSNLMATGGTFGTSAKNGAHEYLNNINDVYDGADDRGFQFLHIGNLSIQDANGEKPAGATDGNGNDDLNGTAAAIRNGGGTAGFTGGDNGNGQNGGFDALNGIANDAAPIAMTAEKPSAQIFEGDAGTKLKSELLDDLSKQGVGLSKNKSFDAGASMDFEDGAEIEIGGETYNVNVTDSEDFENEGYDVVIITITDANGLVVGSMTATEDSKTGRMVEFADNNGDGAVDKVDLEGTTEEGTLGLSTTEWKADPDALAGEYGDAGENGQGENRGSFTLTNADDALAMNEDANDNWNRIAETDPIPTVDEDNTLLTGVNGGEISGWTGTTGADGIGTADSVEETETTVDKLTGVPTDSPLASLPKDTVVTSGTLDGQQAYAVRVDTNNDGVVDEKDDEDIFALYDATGKLISELPANILAKYLPNTELAAALGSSTGNVKTSYIDGIPYYVTPDGEYFKINGEKAEDIETINLSDANVKADSTLDKMKGNDTYKDLEIVQAKDADGNITYLVPSMDGTGSGSGGDTPNDQYQVYDETGELKDYKDDTALDTLPAGTDLAAAVSSAGNETPVHKEYINGVEYYVVGNQYFTIEGVEAMNPMEQDRYFSFNNDFLSFLGFTVPTVPTVPMV